jgi:thioredoxin 1
VVKELTSQNFKSEVSDEESIVVVDFWAPWCGPCQILGPIIDEISEEFKDKKVVFGKLNVDENADIAQEYSIMNIPNIKIFKAGEVVDEIVGLQSKEIMIDKINSHLD